MPTRKCVRFTCTGVTYLDSHKPSINYVLSFTLLSFKVNAAQERCDDVLPVVVLIVTHELKDTLRFAPCSCCLSVPSGGRGVEDWIRGWSLCSLMWACQGAGIDCSHISNFMSITNDKSSLESEERKKHMKMTLMEF